jgi:hypothetical protein
VEVAANAPVLAVPLVVRLPLHAPLAVQLVAFVEVQVSVDDAPLATVVGLALRVTTGAGATVTVADWLVLPPAPVQVSV